MNSCVALCVRYFHVIHQITELLTQIQFFTASKKEAFLNNEREV